ncbi:bi1-like protein [Phtheirospermum japonicum]|uniref:Bi1-like protein n=1 Tax=Phtheirospermum japonicum TaxID=374723 RepID=A0A830D5T3_9LAMI|nr:bi1-like protein [Phtheirospermum japonicum]
MPSQKDDVEARSDLLLCPLMMHESPELRWAFIRKVYSILTLQLLASIAFAAIVVAVEPVASFFNNTQIGLPVFVVILLTPIIVVCLLYFFRYKHPWNFVLLGIFTLYFGLAFGSVCAFVSGKVVIETVIATAVVVISLTAYTFWAAKRGRDFDFLIPFLLSIVVILLTFTTFQICYPMGKISQTMCSGICVIIFSVHIIYDTSSLMKRNSYDDYIWALVLLYLDVLRIFLELFKIFQATSR